MGADVPAGHGAGSPADAELIAAARRGDAAALDALLLRYQPHLYRFGLRMCRNADDAGEVAQESLISMARSLRDFRGESSVSTWLFTIARRFCLKKRRRSAFAPVHEDPLDAPESVAARRLVDPGPDPERFTTNRELAAALTQAIDGLDPAQREVLVLRDVEGLPAIEVARVLGLSVEAVKSRLHRARVAVRQALAPVTSPAAAAPSRATCPDVLTMLSRHVEGDLAPGVCATMERHLSACAQCRETCDSLKQVLAACRQLPTPDVPAPLAASIRAAVHALIRSR
jgi:RNA polymerase sigma-70 factor (ECF subfamily)